MNVCVCLCEREREREREHVMRPRKTYEPRRLIKSPISMTSQERLHSSNT